jgi:tetratricopeptide (TPR) repeat protein
MLTSAAARLDATAAGDWPAWAALQPHVSAVYGYLGGVLGEADLAALTKLAGTAATAFLNAGWAVVAAELAAAALRHAQRLGAEHPTVLQLRGVAARATGESGDDAERELRDLLTAQLRVLGPEHQDTLGTGRQLARLLARQGEYEQAERLLRDLLDAHARALGADHPSTLTTWHDLGLVLAQRGQHAQAAREFAGLLAARARLLGPEHRDTRVTRRWLAHMSAADATVRSG